MVSRLTAAAVLTVGLSACFRPLYGPTPSGVPLQEALASVEVNLGVSSPIGQERLGHYVRSELIYDLDGSGQPHEKKYRLQLTTSENVIGTSIQPTIGLADAAILNGAVTYTLTSLSGTQLFTGTSRTFATYYRDQQRLASVRAARDADIRVARVIADEIKQRLAMYFAAAS